MSVLSAQDDQSRGRAVFRRRHRLPSGVYASVFEARLRKSRGPITLHLAPNGLCEHRLGLSIGRRFGNAVTRGRFKRMMREVFRQERSAMPGASGGGAYDIVVTARAHGRVSYEQYRDWFMEALDAAARVHEKRAGRADG